MIDVVSIKFKNRGKSYYFSPNGLDVHTGDKVIVETAKGLEIADCTQGNHAVMETAVVQPLRPVQRIATKDDLRVAQLNVQREKEAFEICQEKIAKHGLDMKLVDVECNFEGTKTLFFFTADGRVDFRELVKDLASIFRNRIELRQIGVRDEAKMIGGIGICGRPYCCGQFLEDFGSLREKLNEITEKVRDGIDEQELEDIAEELKMDGLQFYAARHTWATLAVNEAGVDKYTVHLALNHVDDKTAVTDIYIRKSWVPIDEANRKVIDYVFKPKDKKTSRKKGGKKVVQ